MQPRPAVALAPHRRAPVWLLTSRHTHCGCKAIMLAALQTFRVSGEFCQTAETSPPPTVQGEHRPPDWWQILSTNVLIHPPPICVCTELPTDSVTAAVSAVIPRHCGNRQLAMRQPTLVFPCPAPYLPKPHEQNAPWRHRRWSNTPCPCARPTNTDAQHLQNLKATMSYMRLSNTAHRCYTQHHRPPPLHLACPTLPPAKPRLRTSAPRGT
eukprot:364493-Chlamydomonas_euryale.AAC.20